MSEYDKVCIETFLRDQLKLFPEKVAETPEEAEEIFEKEDEEENKAVTA